MTIVYKKHEILGLLPSLFRHIRHISKSDETSGAHRSLLTLVVQVRCAWLVVGG